jgi:hypothetical protein
MRTMEVANLVKPHLTVHIQSHLLQGETGEKVIGMSTVVLAKLVEKLDS